MLSEILIEIVKVVASLVSLWTTFNPTTPIPKRALADSYDFIIVGAGSAGATLASRLSEIPNCTVLLLEAGGDENIMTEIPAFANFFRATQFDWHDVTVPQEKACLGFNNRQCAVAAGKIIGGSSSINNMYYVRGNKHDYDHWAALGNVGWEWKNVLPYFLKSEDYTGRWQLANNKYHHTGGNLTVSDVPFQTQLMKASLLAANAIGYPTRDINAEIQSGITPAVATMRNGARCSAAKAFLRSATKRPNLHILLNAFVTKVVFDSRKRATGVIFEHGGGTLRARASKEVILSAGALRSPQLLMLSGIGPKQHLDENKIQVIHDLPGVGNNLQDHLVFSGAIWTIEKEVSIVPIKLLNLSSAVQWLFYGAGPLTILGDIETVVYANTPLVNASDDWPDVQIYNVPTSFVTDSTQVVRRLFRLSDESWNKYLAPVSGKHSYMIMPLILRPKSRGFLKLRTSDPHDPPLIDPKYLSHEDDMQTMMEGLKISLAIGNGAPFQEFGPKFIPTVFPGCENFEFHSDAYWRCVIRHFSFGVHHPVGTNKMGPGNDSMAVVNPQLKVYGVEGLRVVDNSIMPNIVSGNTNVPAIMIGEKAADIIKDELNLRK